MRILLVKPYGPVRVPLPDVGLGFLAMALLRAGHTVDYLDTNQHTPTLGQFCSEIQARQPEVIGFKVFTEEMCAVQAYCREARRLLPDVHLVVGGPHPSAKMSDTFEFIPELDYGVAGEGEVVLPLLLNRLVQGFRGPSAIANIPGLACREAPDTVCVVLANLDDVPRACWELMPPPAYHTPQGILTPEQPYAPICCSRGCPHQCHFCAGGITNGLQVRYRAPQSIVAELLLLRDRYNVRSFGIEDPNFSYDMNQAKTILEAIIKAQIGLPWNTPSGIRADKLDRELVRLMKLSGCTSVSFGVETAKQATLNRLGKVLDLKDVESAVNLCREFGLLVTGFFILGLPGENLSDFRSTVNYACRLDFNVAIFSRLLPVVGSSFFYTIPEMQGLDSPLYYHQHTYMNNCYTPIGITEIQIRNELRRAHLIFYLRPKTILRLLWHLRRNGFLSYGRWAIHYMKRILLRQADDRRLLPQDKWKNEDRALT